MRRERLRKCAKPTADVEAPEEAPWYERQEFCGQLLDVQRFTDGTFHVKLLHSPAEPLLFANSFDCQHFVSNWYARQLVRVNHGRPQAPLSS